MCLRCGHSSCPAAGVPDFHRYGPLLLHDHLTPAALFKACWQVASMMATTVHSPATGCLGIQQCLDRADIRRMSQLAAAGMRLHSFGGCAQ